MWYSAQIADAIKKYGPDYGFDTELKSFEWKSSLIIGRIILKEFVPRMILY